jgi:hypothetical protein
MSGAHGKEFGANREIQASPVSIVRSGNFIANEQETTGDQRRNQSSSKRGK